MLSSPLGQHILDYEPPHGFVIPSLAMYDGSSDPYDHMLHFNQAMILNAGDDRLLCKCSRPASKAQRSVSCRSCSSPSIYAQLGRTRSDEKTNPSRISHEGSKKLSSKLISTVWMQFYKTSREALDQPPHSSSLCP